MTDTGPVPQLTEASKLEDVNDEAKKDEATEDVSVTKPEEMRHSEIAKGTSDSPMSVPDIKPETPIPSQNEPQLPSPPKRPQGKGRVRRFMLKNDAPYIQQPEATNAGAKGKSRKRTMATSSKSAQPFNGNEKDEIVPSVQVPSHITLDPQYLHYDPPEPEPEPAAGIEEADKGNKKEKSRPPPLALVNHNEELPSLTGKTPERLPVSPPERPPRPLRLATGERSTTLYHLLMLVNRTLAAEMKKDTEVKQALYPEIRGPLRALGLLGRFVRLLFHAMKQHEKASWRKKKMAVAARRRGEQWPISGDLMLPEPPFRGALAIFSVPVTKHSRPSPQKQKGEASNDVLGDKKREDHMNGPKGGDGIEKLSILEKGIAREGTGVFIDDDSPVWKAMKKADRRILAGVNKRDYQKTFGSDEDISSSETASDESSNSKSDYLSIASPSLPTRTNKDDLFHQDDDLCPRRHEARTIPEQSKKEAAENKKQRREARAIARQKQEAGKDFKKQAQQEAEAAVRKHLANLTDERDAALYLAQTAVYERDSLGDELVALRKDREQLRRLMKALINKENDLAACVLEDEIKNTEKNYTQDDKENYDEANREELEQRDKVMPLPSTPAGNPLMNEFRQGSSRQPRSPLPPPPPVAPRSPIPWTPRTPTTPMSEWDRRQIFSEAKRVLGEGGSGAPPTTPAFAPPTPRRSFPADISLAYRINTIRPPIGYGIFMTVVDIVYSLVLILCRQKRNFVDVTRWIWYYMEESRYLSWLTKIPTLLKQPLQLPRRLFLKEETKKPPKAPAVCDTSSLALRSRDTHLSRLLPLRSLRPYRSFPRDAFAELVIGILIVIATISSIAAIVERNLWLKANSDETGRAAELQRRFIYTYVLRHRKDTDTCETFPAAITYSPYHICGCVGTWVDIRMFLVPFIYIWTWALSFWY